MVRTRHARELMARFRQRDIKHAVTAPRALDEKLQCERGLSGSRVAFHQVQMIRRPTAEKDFVESGHPGRHAQVCARCRLLNHFGAEQIVTHHQAAAELAQV